MVQQKPEEESGKVQFVLARSCTVIPPEDAAVQQNPEEERLRVAGGTTTSSLPAPDFACLKKTQDPFYGRARCSPMLGAFKT
jgi:hypothetical protein